MSLEERLDKLTEAIDTLTSVIVNTDFTPTSVAKSKAQAKPAPAKKTKPEPEPEEAPGDNHSAKPQSVDMKAATLAALTSITEEINRDTAFKIMKKYSNGAQQFRGVDPAFYGNIIDECKAMLNETA